MHYFVDTADNARMIMWQINLQAMSMPTQSFILAHKWSEVKPGKGRGRDSAIDCTAGMTATLTQPFDLTSYWSSWLKITHPLKLRSLLRRMARSLTKHWKKPRTKVQLMGKKVIATPPNTVILNSMRTSPWNLFLCVPSRTVVPSMHNWRKRLITWSYLQSIMRHIFKYKS